MKLEICKDMVIIKGLDWFEFHKVVLKLMEKKLNFKTYSINYNIKITNIGINKIKNLLKTI